MAPMHEGGQIRISFFLSSLARRGCVRKSHPRICCIQPEVMRWALENNGASLARRKGMILARTDRVNTWYKQV